MPYTNADWVITHTKWDAPPKYNPVNGNWPTKPGQPVPTKNEQIDEENVEILQTKKLNRKKIEHLVPYFVKIFLRDMFHIST